MGVARVPARVGDHDGRPSPRRAAVLALVTLTVWGFWWWWDLNRRLARAGQPAKPGQELTAVTLGWVAVVPPFRSVQRTVSRIAAAQARAGLPATADPHTAVELAVMAAAGFVAFVAGSTFWAPGVPLFGWITPVFGMFLVAYVQREMNRLPYSGATTGT